MRTLRALPVPLLLASALPAPASAATEEAFTGTVTIDCFGCGDSTGTATLSFLGGSATATFDVNAPAHLCPALTIMEGEIHGAMDMTFTWTAAGSAMLLDGEDDEGRSFDGVGVFSTQPGNPCGQGDVTVTVAGTLVSVP